MIHHLVGPTWGCPWHGVIKGGQLDTGLPTPQASIKRPWPQPTTGDVLRVKPPGTPPINRTAQQLHDDQQRGHRWLDYALISGEVRILHGKPLGPNTWLYCPTPGRCWSVRLLTTQVNVGVEQGPYTLRFQLRRFGLFTGEQPASEVQVQLPTLGQSEPQISLWAGHSYRLIGSAGRLYLEDANSDGSRAIIGIDDTWGSEQFRITYRPNGSAHEERWYQGYIPIGFLLVEVTGDGTQPPHLAVSILADRQQTLGSVQANRYTRTPQITYRRVLSDACCRNGTVTQTWNFAVANRVIGYWYDDDHGPTPVTIGYSYTATEIERYITSGKPRVDGYFSVTGLAYEYTARSHMHVTISPGVGCDMSRNASAHSQYDYDTGVEVSSWNTSATSTHLPPINRSGSGTNPDCRFLCSEICAGTWPCDPPFASDSGEDPARLRYMAAAPSYGWHEYRPMRLSGQCYALVASSTTGRNVMRLVHIVGKWGEQSVNETQTDDTPGHPRRWYGSQHPNGSVVYGYQPVCYA